MVFRDEGKTFLEGLREWRTKFLESPRRTWTFLRISGMEAWSRKNTESLGVEEKNYLCQSMVEGKKYLAKFQFFVVFMG